MHACVWLRFTRATRRNRCRQQLPRIPASGAHRVEGCELLWGNAVVWHVSAAVSMAGLAALWCPAGCRPVCVGTAWAGVLGLKAQQLPGDVLYSCLAAFPWPAARGSGMWVAIDRIWPAWVVNRSGVADGAQERRGAVVRGNGMVNAVMRGHCQVRGVAVEVVGSTGHHRTRMRGSWGLLTTHRKVGCRSVETCWKRAAAAST